MDKNHPFRNNLFIQIKTEWKYLHFFFEKFYRKSKRVHQIKKKKIFLMIITESLLYEQKKIKSLNTQEANVSELIFFLQISSNKRRKRDDHRLLSQELYQLVY